MIVSGPDIGSLPLENRTHLLPERAASSTDERAIPDPSPQVVQDSVGMATRLPRHFSLRDSSISDARAVHWSPPAVAAP